MDGYKIIDNFLPIKLFNKIYYQFTENDPKVQHPFWMYTPDFKRKEIQQSQMEELHSMYRNVVTEFQIPLAVVKSEESDKKHRYEHNLSLPDGSSAPVDAPSNIIRY